MTRGEHVHYMAARTEAGRPAEPSEGIGLVLDRTDVRGEWWVIPPGAGRAVRVKASDMLTAAPMHGRA